MRARGAIVLVIAVLAAAVGFAWLVGGSDGGAGGDTADEADGKAITDYEAKLLPLVQEWGRIEVQGMRPAIGDLRSGEGVPPETVGGEARAWQAGLKDLRAKIAALEPPPALRRTELLFDRAMVRYIEAAEEFERAADGPVAGREAGIQKGIETALDGARLYNEASLVLQRARQQAGLPPTQDFPNHSAGEEKVE